MFGAHFGTSGKLLLLTELSLQCCYQIIGTVRTDGIGKSPCRWIPMRFRCCRCIYAY